MIKFIAFLEKVLKCQNVNYKVGKRIFIILLINIYVMEIKMNNKQFLLIEKKMLPQTFLSVFKASRLKKSNH